MPKDLEIRNIVISGELDKGQTLGIEIYREFGLVNSKDAKQIVDHLTKLFGLTDWIKIEDEQPRDGQNVQAIGTWYGEIEEEGEDDYQGIGEWRGGIVYMDTDTCSTQIHNITHWKPLKWPGD